MSKLLMLPGIILVTAFFITSCKKGSVNKLVGTWDVKRLGLDFNGNEVMDSSEVHDISGFGSGTLIFNANGTGSEHINFVLYDTTITMAKWVLQNNNQDLLVTASNGVTTLSHISLTGNMLTFTDTGKPMTWLICQKR